MNTTSQSAADREKRELASLRWTGDYLEMLDQRLLPEQIIFLALQEAEEVWEAIFSMKVRGAPAIGIAAAYGVYLGIRHYEPVGSSERERRLDLERKVNEVADRLATSRPTAVNLFWALDRIRRLASGWGTADVLDSSIDDLKKAVLREAVRIQEEDETTCRLIGEHALSLFQDGMGVLTHCNAGGLATARYGTALAPFYLAKAQGWKLKVFADETRPVLQGARLTAFELQQAGIDVTLICDNMAGMVMAKGWIQAVIVGTDRIAANGDVANKIGTYSVAVLAKAHGIPFYVASPLSTIDMNTPTGEQIPIEERHESEITEGFGKRTAPQGVKVFNPAFDVTPNEYVTAIITEKGIVRPSYKENLPKLFQ
ncbi:S-methyl-5-thioribose-1-phosphate isomerase [Paenibacillus sp. J2TS4]|uniref:S-methyl-5-thioribose-1-phosphate isomerase n=1 Tax=Paenibacillus sp. J2TS4 TaxID=2807194 RepID=UPI001B1F590B|nr:S-methyl-5-thioribose-1-phosphate isomerase [Paenibacillus sp. J2TS4]GIP33666.1 methylthioribose-1-phosphate isomerase 1 [Paenibacillus sp. J2TS4]